MADMLPEVEENRIRAIYARRDTAGKRGLYARHWQDVLLGRYRLRSVVASMFASKLNHRGTEGTEKR